MDFFHQHTDIHTREHNGGHHNIQDHNPLLLPLQCGIANKSRLKAASHASRNEFLFVKLFTSKLRCHYFRSENDNAFNDRGVDLSCSSMPTIQTHGQSDNMANAIELLASVPNHGMLQTFISARQMSCQNRPYDLFMKYEPPLDRKVFVTIDNLATVNIDGFVGRTYYEPILVAVAPQPTTAGSTNQCFANIYDIYGKQNSFIDSISAKYNGEHGTQSACSFSWSPAERQIRWLQNPCPASGCSLWTFDIRVCLPELVETTAKFGIRHRSDLVPWQFDPLIHEGSPDVSIQPGTCKSFTRYRGAGGEGMTYNSIDIVSSDHRLNVTVYSWTLFVFR
jgi:hypothetical protein